MSKKRPHTRLSSASGFQTRARFQGTTALLSQRNFGTKALPCGDANCSVPDSRAVKCSQDWRLAHPWAFHPRAFRRDCWRHPVPKQVLPEERNPGAVAATSHLFLPATILTIAHSSRSWGTCKR